MSETEASLTHKISSAQHLQSVVRTMKALAASSIGQYTQSARALKDYDHTVEAGLEVCLRENAQNKLKQISNSGLSQISSQKSDTTCVIVFGSDQGLIGQFNEVIAEYTLANIKALSGHLQFFAVGVRIQTLLLDAGIKEIDLFAVPSSVQAIGPLVGRIQIATEKNRHRDESAHVYLFYNRPKSGALYEPVNQRLLPLDKQWSDDLLKMKWPGRVLPEIIGGTYKTLHGLIREYLFISIFRSCAESLASENASRLAAMQRADKNIDELLESLRSTYHRLRQGSIDEELFDVVAGFEALTNKGEPQGRERRGQRK
jgi:F-type H+-transporting ATPase subunit gamma